MRYNFPPHTKGDTFISPTFQVVLNGTPIDLANYTLKMEIRASVNSTPVKTFTSADGLEIVGPTTDGKFKITTTIIDIPVGKYLYDIQFTDTNSEVNTWIKGVFKVIKEITQ